MKGGLYLCTSGASMNDRQAASRKAHRTARWATTMTKWLVSRLKRRPTWQLVAFQGPAGRESRGVVDLVAIRKDHRTVRKEMKRGDIFEIVLIQVKGGSASWPSRSDVLRLRKVARHHRAKAIVLADWQRGRQPTLFRLKRNLGQAFNAREAWVRVEPTEIFD